MKEGIVFEAEDPLLKISECLKIIPVATST
jgi:hypothetical protein